MTNRIIIVYCGLLLTLTAFSIDILLPAFSLMSLDLNAPVSDVQLQVPFFIAAVGVGQLFGGSISDRFGRRTVIQAGLLIYICGVIIAMLATSIEMVLAGRILQGLGGSAGPVVARAIIRDLYSGKELARNIAMATAIFAFGPIVAPLAGVGLLVWFDWRSLFALMLVFATVLLLVCIFFLPETIGEKNSNATRIKVFARNIATVLIHPQSRFYILLSGLMMSMMMIILINIPIIFESNFAITGAAFAVFFAIHGLGIIIGQVLNRMLIQKIGIEQTSLVGASALVVVSISLLITSMYDAMTPWLLALMMIGHATSYLVVYANTATMTLDPHGKIAGFTSSFFGFFSQVVSSIIGGVLTVFIGGSLINWSAFLLLFAGITFLALWYKIARPAT